MSADYKGLMRGNHNPIDLARMIAARYGGDDFSVHINDTLGESRGFYWITFRQRPTDEQMLLLPWERGKVIKTRRLAVFTDGDCAGDYAELTTEPMTLLSLGSWGDCADVIDPLVASTGGWIMDEGGDQEWHAVAPLPPLNVPASVEGEGRE